MLHSRRPPISTLLRVAAPFLLIFVLAGCQALQLDSPVRVQEGDWWTTGASNEHNSSVETSLAPPLSEAWSYNALAAFGPGSALVLGDVVLVANLQGELHAISLETGKKVGQAGFSDAIRGTPAIGRGRIVVGTAWGKRSLQGYDLERASKMWKRDAPRIVAGLVPFDDGTLVADAEGGVRLIDSQDGSDRWFWEDPDGRAVLSTPLLSQGHYIVAFDDGTVRGFDPATGGVAWTTELEQPIYASPTASGGTVYVPTTRGSVVALDVTTGRETWRFRTASEAIKIASPSIGDGTIYFGASDGFVRAISTEFGEPRWRTQVEAAVSAQVMVTGNHVYVGTMSNQLIALDRSEGLQVWNRQLRGRVKSAMAVTDGGLLVLMEPRFVSLFVPEGNDATK